MLERLEIYIKQISEELLINIFKIDYIQRFTKICAQINHDIYFATKMYTWCSIKYITIETRDCW